MKVSRLVVAVAAVALLAGCFAPGPSYESAPPVRSEPSLTPGSVPDVSYQVGYSFKAEFAYEGTSTDDQDGDDFYDASLYTLRFTWYPQGVSDDDVPYALQPYMQRAGYVRAGAGTGALEPDGQDDVDTNTWELGFAVFNPETGFGFRAGQRYLKRDEGPAGSMGDDMLTGSAVWQDGDGFSAEFGLVKRTSAVFFEELGIYFAAASQAAYRAVRLGARKAFILENGQAIDVSGSVDFGRFDVLKGPGVDTGSNLYRLAVTYYPIKMLGIGLSYAARTFESDEDLGGGVSLEDFESGEFGLNVTATVVERIDIGVTYRSLERDLRGGTNDVDELSEFGVTLGVRF